MDKDGDGCVDLEEFMHWYESNHSGGEASAIEGGGGGGGGGDGSKRHSKRLLAKLESWSDQLLALVNEDGASPASLLPPSCIVSLTRARVSKEVALRVSSGGALFCWSHTASSSCVVSLCGLAIAVNMPHGFIWVHVDATARIQTLKPDSSRLDRQ